MTTTPSVGIYGLRRDRVLGALIKRGLIVDENGEYTATEAGRAAIARAEDR